jgi:hypothetical protein
MPPHAQNDTFVSPFHGPELTAFRSLTQPPRPSSFRDGERIASE